MQEFLLWFFDPSAWASLAGLIVLEIVLGIDNLIFVSILTNKLPERHRPRRARSAWAWRSCCGWRCLA